MGFIDVLSNNLEIPLSRSFIEGILKKFDGKTDYELPGKDAELSNRIITSRNHGENERVLELCDIALGMYPENPDILNEKGIALKIKGQYAEAKACYEKAITIKDGFYEAWANKGMALFLSGQYENGLECVKRAIGIDDKKLLAYAVGILCLDKLDRFDEAKEYFTKSFGRAFPASIADEEFVGF